MPAKLTRVRLRDYKSIGTCDVELQDLTLLIGPNGAGKSNFMGCRIKARGSVLVPFYQLTATASDGRIPNDLSTFTARRPEL